MDKRSWQKIFGTSQCPAVDFGLSDMPKQAEKMAGKSSISGVQPKIYVDFDKKKNILIRADDGEYILKSQSPHFPNVPENEQCCMDIAGEIGIDVPPHCLLPLKDKSFAYVVKRFDRKGGEKINQEDFFQVLGPKDKYIGSVEQIGKKLKEISSVPGLDVQLFFERVVFYFLIGNGDAHFKNYSITHRDDGQIRLTPAYDIVCSRLVTKDDESALTINGKNNNLGRKDFDVLAEYFKIPEKVRYEKFEKKFDVMKKIIESSQIDQEKQGRFIEIVKERATCLKLPL
ncbi:MAG: HipA domain-containing protein [Candidatus Omnitrophota bacterium]|nr:HipA domain-containing protein [Candidatus Omnitrophota bacterium]